VLDSAGLSDFARNLFALFEATGTNASKTSAPSLDSFGGCF
jgi:hypothetical protein